MNFLNASHFGKCVQVFKGIFNIFLCLDMLMPVCNKLGNLELASCPWGPVTAKGMDLLTNVYIIYMQVHTLHHTISLSKMEPLGPTVGTSLYPHRENN